MCHSLKEKDLWDKGEQIERSPGLDRPAHGRRGSQAAHDHARSLIYKEGITFELSATDRQAPTTPAPPAAPSLVL